MDFLLKHQLWSLKKMPFSCKSITTVCFYQEIVLNTDFLCSPAGWDNEKKIGILYENMHSIRPDQYYTDVIAKPIVRKSTNNRDVEITAEDEQQFLLR